MIAECESKSTRQVAKDLIQKSHQPALLAAKFHMSEMVENGKIVDQTFTKFEALLDDENSELLQEFKNLYAHELEDVGNISVLKFLLQKAVAFKKKKLGLKPNKETKIENKKMVEHEEQKNNAQLPMSPNVPKARKAGVPQRKPLSAAVKRYVWQRANACCEYKDAKSGTRCSSRFALQPDHITPLALGGTDDVTNLQLLCRSHNSRRAVKTFGVRR